MPPLDIPEFWKPIPGWPYLASDEGRIQSLTRTLPHRLTGGEFIRPGRVLKPKKTKFGYHLVTLQHKKVKRHAFVHVLVAEAFLGRKPKDYCVNHINFIRTDNWLGNLEYATLSENVMHSMRNGRYPKINGELHPSVKLKNEDVLAIRLSLSSKTSSASALSKKYRVSQATISLIRHRKIWGHI